MFLKSFNKLNNTCKPPLIPRRLYISNKKQILLWILPGDIQAFHPQTVKKDAEDIMNEVNLIHKCYQSTDAGLPLPLW